MHNAAKRQIIAIVLFGVFGAILIYDILFIKPQPISKFVSSQGDFPVPNDKQVPPISARILTQFNSTESFSANNEMTITTNVYVNDTKFLDHYCCLGMMLSNGGESTAIPLAKYADKYIGSVNMVWKSGGDLYYWFVPKDPTIGIPAGPGNTVQVFTIGDQGETYSWKYGIEATQLAWVVLAFSVILLQPIFDALFRLKSS